jgi:hypothetical protein
MREHDIAATFALLHEAGLRSARQPLAVLAHGRIFAAPLEELAACTRNEKFGPATGRRRDEFDRA